MLDIMFSSILSFDLEMRVFCCDIVVELCYGVWFSFFPFTGIGFVWMGQVVGGTVVMRRGLHSVLSRVI